MAPVRIIVAKPGLDGHDRGAKVVARALRDAGFEVVYTGLHQSPEQIVDAAIQEDADAIGLSVLSGAHLTLFARVLDLLEAKDAADIVVFGGGIIPEDDVAELERIGVKKVFTPGAPMHDIVDWVRANVGETGTCADAETAHRLGPLVARIARRDDPHLVRSTRAPTHAARLAPASRPTTVRTTRWTCSSIRRGTCSPRTASRYWTPPSPRPRRRPARRAERLGGGTVVVKAQVKTGGRGKAGGVKLAHCSARRPSRGPARSSAWTSRVTPCSA